jgi:hypothetical protein
MQICFLQKKVKYLYIAKLIGGKRVVAHGNAQNKAFVLVSSIGYVHGIIIIVRPCQLRHGHLDFTLLL